MKLTYSKIDSLYQLPCHVYWKDVTGIYRGANDYFMKMGVPNSREILGLNDFELCCPENANKFQENDQTVMAQQQSLLTVEDVKWLKNDISYSVFTYKQPLYSHKGNILGVLGMSFLLSKKLLDPVEIKKSNFASQLLTTNILNDAHDNKRILTARQEECLYLLAKGETAKGIAKQLNLSVRTIEHHLAALKIKFKCYSRTDLIAKALTMPLIIMKLNQVNPAG